MEDKELLKEITYWSQLINRGRSQQYPVNPSFKSVAVRPSSTFQSRYSKVNLNNNVSAKIPSVEKKFHNENLTCRSSPISSRYSWNSRKPCAVSVTASGPNQTIPSPPKTVYINKKMLSVKVNSPSKYDRDLTGKKRGVYLNPNFVAPPTVNRSSSSVSVPAQKPFGTRVPELHPVINSKGKTLINPAFSTNSVGVPPSSLGDKVYVNPKFLKSKPQSQLRLAGTVSDKTPNINASQTNTVIEKTEPPGDQKNKTRSGKLILSKHKLIRRRSGSFSNGLKYTSAKNASTPSAFVHNHKKYKINNKFPVKVNQKCLKNVSNLVLNGGKNREFQGSKYAIVRRRSTSKSADFQAGESSSARPKLLRRNSLKSVALQLQLGKSRSELNRTRTLSDSFKIVGRTKIVRKSVLQSQIIARRSLTNSRFKYMRNIINSDRKTISPQINPVLKRPSVLHSKFKIVRKHNESLAASKKFHPSKPGYCTPKHNKRSIVNICGILYKSSRNKLIRRDIPKGSDLNGKIVRVGGVKFQLNHNGRTLRRVRKDSMNLDFSKVDIGKLTSVNLNNKVNSVSQSLTTNPRLRLKAARQKSLSVLTAKLRKCNQPCLFFNRFGYCKRKENSTCEKVHDPKLVAVCKKFLKGECKNETCPLSHSLAPEKMPICHHFLRGGCMRDCCPYLHVKHNSKTPICLPFLDGYCPNASTCTKRHEYVCPAFSEKGVCPRGKRCTYPHPSVKKQEFKPKTLVPVFKDNDDDDNTKLNETKPKESVAGEVSSVRYFVSAQQLDELESGPGDEDSSSDKDVILIEDSDDELDVQETSLPQYIPLDQDVVQ